MSATHSATDVLRHADLAELRHNLRTPVNHILGYSEMLLEDAADAHHAAALSAFRNIQSAGRGALGDVNEALANRESVPRSELDNLFEKVRPRVERVLHCLDELRNLAETPVPQDWQEDFDRIGAASKNLLALLSDSPGEPVPVSMGVRPKRQTAGPRLLVVDDNAVNRNVLSRRLERQGYAVEEAKNGEDALDRIATESYDLVLLDILMPVMDGFGVLERMKKDRRMRSVPVIVISALDEVDSVVRAIEMGAEDYLLKPFDPVLLRARIGALLERRRLSEELAVQAKLASLGALTAGIAHEIKNPLNFVLNFAELAAESVGEQRHLLEGAEPPTAEVVVKLRELTCELEDDIAKVREHGARADGIIGSMLAHTRGQPGERQSIDLNELVRDYVNLAFHGLRAQDNTFQVEIPSEYDAEVGMVSVIPQDLSRAILNVAGNAFHAVREKARRGKAGYRPEVRVSTRNFGGRVEIRIRDNGIGIPKDRRDRIFDPFFTTKAAGEGTGLGLSISYEIVVGEHGGEFRVDSQEGEYTEFTLVIPRGPAGLP